MDQVTDPLKPKRCPGCDLCDLAGTEPTLYTRWCNTTPQYHWVACGDAPPCETGPCHQTPEEAVEGWNREADARGAESWGVVE
jgi:hypothetical protein